MTWQPQITSELFDTDATTSLGSLTGVPGAGGYRGASRRKWLDEGNGLGGCSFEIGREHPLADDLTDGRFVRHSIGGTPCFTMRIESDPAYTESHPNDVVNQTMVVKGRSWGSVVEDAVIKPEWGFGLPFNGSWRVWSFASIGFPNAGTWGPVVELYEYRDGVTVSPTRHRVIAKNVGDPPVLTLYPAPIAWPWSEAPKNGNGFAPTPTYDPTYWVEADGSPDEEAAGFRFSRGTFGLAGEQAVTIFVTADNLFRFFLDGVPILAEYSDIAVWQGWKMITLNLPAGSHLVGVQWENIDAPSLGPGENPSAALVQVIAISVYPGDTETSLTLSLFSSTASDMVESFYSADDWPGWSVGQIWGTWIPEVQANGLCAPYDTGASSFDGDVDSNGDTWSSVIDSLKYIPLFAMEIGRTGLDLLNRFYDDGWADWHTRPDVLTIDLFNQGTSGVDSGVEFAYGPVGVGNIAAPIKRGVAKPYANRLLVQWGKDQVVPVDDLAAQASKGTVVEAMFATDAASQSDAIRRGLVELSRTTTEGRPAVTIDVIPTSAADAPYEAFGVFDKVTVPAEGGGTVLQPVLAIGVNERDDGTPEYQLLVNRRRHSRAQDQLQMFRQLGGKQMGNVGEAGRVN